MSYKWSNHAKRPQLHSTQFRRYGIDKNISQSGKIKESLLHTTTLSWFEPQPIDQKFTLGQSKNNQPCGALYRPGPLQILILIHIYIRFQIALRTLISREKKKIKKNFFSYLDFLPAHYSSVISGNTIFPIPLRRYWLRIVKPFLNEGTIKDVGVFQRTDCHLSILSPILYCTIIYIERNSFNGSFISLLSKYFLKPTLFSICVSQTFDAFLKHVQ